MVRVFSLPPERLVYVRVLWTSVGATERAIFSLPPERLVYVRVLWTSVGATGRAYSSLPLPSASITGSCRFVNTHLVFSLITRTRQTREPCTQASSTRDEHLHCGECTTRYQSATWHAPFELSSDTSSSIVLSLS
jgi:hypothetical protein